MKQTADAYKEASYDVVRDAAIKAEKLESEADTLKCWRKP